ncbi:MAG: sulfotransferase domain-containing protein [Chloroflexi bacterium]|nr:sulfotransferase domain-containing protein [Chloroflexota bacterium]
MLISTKKRLLQVKWINHLVFNQLYHFQTDCYVISYPKSGRTWLRILIGNAMAQHFNVDLKNDEPGLIVKQYKFKAPYVRFSHDRVANAVEENGRLFREKYSYYRRQKIILLVRDPRDVIISYYFHRTRRLNEQHQLDDFIQHPLWGIDRQLYFLNEWSQHQDIPNDFLLLRYEDLINNTFDQLKKVFTFLSLEIANTHLEEAITYAQFENMKKRILNSPNQINERLEPTDPSDNQSHKVREGRIGGHQQYLNNQQIELLNNKIQTTLNPIFEYPYTKVKS